MIYITKQKVLNQNKGCFPFGQSSRNTVWVNGKQNSRLVFRPGMAFTICTNPFSEKRPQRPETGIKDGFEEMVN